MNCRFIVDVRNKLSNRVNDNTRLILLETFEKIICVGMPKVLKYKWYIYDCVRQNPRN